jgi:putative membrane protein
MPEEIKRLHPASILIVAAAQSRQLATAFVLLLISRFSGGEGRFGAVDIMAAVLGIFAVVPAIVHYFTVRYQVGEDAFTMWSGLLFKQKRIIPLERIQNVSIKRNVLERALGVSSLQIETAGGTGAEAELSVVKVDEADRLAHVLKNIAPPLSAPTDEDGFAPPVVVRPEPVYRASLKQLFLAGATQNKAGIIVLFFIGILNYAQQAIPRIVERTALPDWTATPAVSLIVASIFGLVVLLLAGWILSIVTTVVSYYGFELRREEGLLRLRHGLLTQIQAAVPVRRIQTLRVVQPILQRSLGYTILYAHSAASFTDKQAGGAVQLSPIIEDVNAPSVLDVVFKGLDVWHVDWQKVSPLTKRRGFFRYLLVGLIVVGALEAAFGLWIFALLPFVGVLAWFAAWKRYQILGYSRRGGFLFARAGVWTRSITVLPENRIQSTSITQGPIQRRLKLCNLTVFSAAAGAGALVIVDLSLPTALELQDQLGATSDTLDPILEGGL